MTNFELNDTIKVFCSKGERKYFEMAIGAMSADWIETLLSEGVSRILNDSHSSEADIDKARAIFEEKMEECENENLRFGTGGFGKTRLTPYVIALRAFIRQVAVSRKIKPAEVADFERAGMATIEQWAQEDGKDVAATVAKVEAHIEAQLAATADLF